MTIKLKPIKTTIEFMLESEYLEEPFQIVLKKPSHVDCMYEYPKIQIRLQEIMKASGLTSEDFASEELSLKKFEVLEALLKAQVEMVKLLKVNLTDEEIDGLTQAKLIPVIIESYNKELEKELRLEAEKKS